MTGPTQVVLGLSGLTTTEETMCCHGASKLGYANFACTNQPTGLHEIDLSGLHGQPDMYMSTQRNLDRVKNECEVHSNFSRRSFQVKDFSHTVCYIPLHQGATHPKQSDRRLTGPRLLSGSSSNFNIEHQ